MAVLIYNKYKNKFLTTFQLKKTEPLYEKLR